jgi:hypothetical protein
MPRPKPPEPLKHRYIRLSDRQFVIFNYLGGAEWLRKLLDKKDPFPKKYYDAILKTGGQHALCKQTPTIQKRICPTESQRRA